MIKNLSSINDKKIKNIAKEMGIKNLFRVIILVNPELDKHGDAQFNFEEQICFISLKLDNDLSTLVHELRHVWQMEQIGPECFLALYQEELKHEGYFNNVFEIDAFSFEENWAA